MAIVDVTCRGSKAGKLDLVPQKYTPGPCRFPLPQGGLGVVAWSYSPPRQQHRAQRYPEPLHVPVPAMLLKAPLPTAAGSHVLRPQAIPSPGSLSILPHSAEDRRSSAHLAGRHSSPCPQNWGQAKSQTPQELNQEKPRGPALGYRTKAWVGGRGLWGRGGMSVSPLGTRTHHEAGQPSGAASCSCGRAPTRSHHPHPGCTRTGSGRRPPRRCSQLRRERPISTH